MAKDKNAREKELVESIKGKLRTGKVSEAVLETDERVLARITDGIYRQPSSALRELIANAYDADAENVYIQTDAPRFQQIRIWDDGDGFSVESLANLIYHIGGSPKRTPLGIKLGVADDEDSTLSPKGRRLIGKIGIGLFSVSQLTRHFQIITKQIGTDYRLVAEVELLTYTEDYLSTTDPVKPDVKTGKVKIISIAAEKKEEHGTEVILLNLKPQTRELLQSQDLWIRIEDTDGLEPTSGVVPPKAPKFHIGRFVNSKRNEVSVTAKLPWSDQDRPKDRFGKLVQSLIDEVQEGEPNPRLETLFDNYLRMLWVLSLSAPLDYIDKHPFDLTNKDKLYFYEISNHIRGQPARLDLRPKESIRSRLKLVTPERGDAPPFNVFVDEVQLFRPIRFHDLPETSHAIKQPMMFVGSYKPDLSGIKEDIRGGNLAFEAYLLWVPKVVPKENTGLIIRISDASGTLFDESFIKYQVSEQTRLRQITAEIFVREGLDAALNIDRESYNFAHPHYQIVMKWVHSALRQVANAHKDLASQIRSKEQQKEAADRTKKVQKTVADELQRAGINDEEDVPDVVFTNDPKKAAESRKQGDMAFDSDVIFKPLPPPGRNTKQAKSEREIYQERMKGVAQILDAYGLFERLSYAKQQELLRAILAIFVKED